MNELMQFNRNENNEPCVSGRELHEFLEVDTPYHIWFPRMKEYGFVENIDFMSFEQNCSNPQGGRPKTDHVIKLDMAKELSMIQRTEKGKQARQYFIQIEKEYNSPEKIMARALQIAQEELSTLRLTTQVQQQQIQEMQPKVSYYDLVLQSPDLMTVTQIAKDYGESAKSFNQILHENKIQFKQNGTWLLYQRYADQGYTKTKTQTFEKKDGTRGTSVHTYWTQKGRLFLYDLLKSKGVLPVIER